MTDFTHAKVSTLLPYAEIAHWSNQHEKQMEQLNEEEEEKLQQRLSLAHSLVEKELQSLLEQQNISNTVHDDKEFIEHKRNVEEKTLQNTYSADESSFTKNSKEVISSELLRVKENQFTETNVVNNYHNNTENNTLEELQSLNCNIELYVSSNDGTNDKRTAQDAIDALRYETLLSEYINNKVLETQLSGRNDKISLQTLAVLEQMQRLQFDLAMTQREINDNNAARYIEQRSFALQLQEMNKENAKIEAKISALEKMLKVSDAEETTL